MNECFNVFRPRAGVIQVPRRVGICCDFVQQFVDESGKIVIDPKPLPFPWDRRYFMDDHSHQIQLWKLNKSHLSFLAQMICSVDVVLETPQIFYILKYPISRSFRYQTLFKEASILYNTFKLLRFCTNKITLPYLSFYLE